MAARSMTWATVDAARAEIERLQAERDEAEAGRVRNAEAIHRMGREIDRLHCDLRQTEQGRENWRWAAERLRRESDEARAEVERLRLSLVCLRDAAVWVLNVAHGVGKGGDAPQDGEYTEALTQLAMAVSSAVSEAGEPEGRDEG